MYVVGLDADTLVSKLEEILIVLIKYIAGTNIKNLSPPLLGNYIFFFYYINIMYIYIEIEIERIIFFSDVNKKIINFFIFNFEVGKIFKFILHINKFVYVKNVISAGCLLVLPWKNNTIKYRYYYIYLYLLIYNNLLFVFNFLFNLKINLYNSLMNINNFLFNKLAITPDPQGRGLHFNITHPFKEQDRLKWIRKFEHLNKHSRPNTEDEFGYYLAGLIEGDGYIGKRSIEISFHISDISLAYYIKKRIGYGNVIKYTHTSKAVRYGVWNKEGVNKILNLVNGKFFTKHKIDQINKFKLNYKFNLDIKESIYEKYNGDIDKQKTWILSNYWLCGFTDADGSFTIHLSKSKTHKIGYNLKLEYKLVQKSEEILLAVKNIFGGFSYFDTKGFVFRYRFASLKEQYKVIDYFDKYQLNSSKYIRYLKWRKCYRLYLDRQHIHAIGVQKILNIIKSLRD
jgi:hypothetical protein